MAWTWLQSQEAPQNLHYLAYILQRQKDFSFQAVLSSLALSRPKGEGTASLGKVNISRKEFTAQSPALLRRAREALKENKTAALKAAPRRGTQLPVRHAAAQPSHTTSGQDIHKTSEFPRGSQPSQGRAGSTRRASAARGHQNPLCTPEAATERPSRREKESRAQP